MKRSVQLGLKTHLRTYFLCSISESYKCLTLRSKIPYFVRQRPLQMQGWSLCVCLCESVHCPETVLLLNQSTALGPGSWDLCHILSLPTRPPAAHQEEEIRTIPSCHCSATRAFEEERAQRTLTNTQTLTQPIYVLWRNLFTLVILRKKKRKKGINWLIGFNINLQQKHTHMLSYTAYVYSPGRSQEEEAKP